MRVSTPADGVPSIETEHSARHRQDGYDEHGPDQRLSALQRSACTQLTTEREADHQRAGGDPVDLVVEDEDRDGDQREGADHDHLDGVRPDQIDSASGEGSDQKQADAGLEGASVEPDGEEDGPVQQA